MKRKDKNGYELYKGECQRSDGRYSYNYTDRFGKRHYVYAKTLKGMRLKKRELQRDYEDGLDPDKARQIEVNHMIEKYLENKHDLKESTMGSYKYVFESYIRDSIGTRKILNVKYSDIKSFYYKLMIEDGLSGTTVDHVHTLLHPSFQMAVRDGLLRINPTDGVMAEVKRSKYWAVNKRKALTVTQQQNFLDFMKKDLKYTGWRPIITVLLGTGMRIGECLGLTWNDLDFDRKVIYVRRALTDRPDSDRNTRKRIETPKSEAGTREIPMITQVFDAFLEEYELQKYLGFCEEEIDGVSDFVFVNSVHKVYIPSAINRAIHQIINDFNALEMDAAKQAGREPELLPDFSAHSLRHTFCTRFCENESNTKVIQEIMGHSDITTTMNIYAEATIDSKKKAMKNLEGKIIF